MEDIERRRAQLEENVNKLRQAVSHWRQWELEYEMLKEEIQHANSPSASQMLQIGRDMGGRVVKEKEVEELLGNGPTKRSANQIVDMISKRVDYVQQNLSTVEKQLDTAEKQLDATSLLLNPGMVDEQGLPMMEIEEELDEEGNVISGSVSEPGKQTPALVEALRKAGIQKSDLDEGKNPKITEVDSDDEPSSSGPSKTATDEPKPVPSQTAPQSGSILKSKVESEPSQSTPQKSVSFAEDTRPLPSGHGQSNLEATGYNEMLDDFNWTRGSKVIEIDDDEQPIASYPIIPQDESPESAELRRQMLQYGLSEVGQVVAELDLDQPTASYSDDEVDDDYGEDYDSDEESEDEDQYGRSTRRVLTEDYEKQMRELEQKLNARMLENVGPRPEKHPYQDVAEDVRMLRVRKDDEVDKVMPAPAEEAVDSEPKKKSKGVRFASNLDISEVPEPPKEQQALPGRPTPTMSETVIERSGPPQPPKAPSAKPGKVSRFKSARAASNQPPASPLPTPHVSEQPPVPTGPPGRTVADTVVEHAAAPETRAPDEFDPVVINREVQTQYHKMRNRMIQQQGGFAETEEDVEDPIMEERGGMPKKVSRFKAAKLKAAGLDQ
ncbi:hypothetical protein BS50DRAFT_567881 [Corynespora cassiicola Philippines]|uniref:DUF3835 domain-containing protein n=1 Tax=Corynespora cassiicola Philippines TaxID=1448308 RepID=A0A2T2PCA5_CORCC|nr:hypothetical protein BS50DRAFT_567881 [Corynespora cassiicola Philippines]